ncbi:hypothetical protein D0T66_05295 [Dysgonomonas sp. 25]|nr:hypothetical protein [Dysgonomonas sp. 25]
MNANSGANSTKGLGLPKVELSDLSKLKIGTAPEITGADALEHTGLIVYNAVPSQCISAGVYIWDGTQWEQLTRKGAGIGSYEEDVQALKDLYSANLGNTLGWNLSADPSTFAGVVWRTICGEKRVTELNIASKNLTSATGIDKLYVLAYLSCGGNQLTSLDVSTNTALTDLYCSANQLTSLDVLGATALKNLYCGGNQLTSLDVSTNTALTILNCYSNQLTSLDVSTNTALTILDCYSNQLTSLDVLGATALRELYCYSNQLTSLDVSANTALTFLQCQSNQLTQTEVNKFKLHPNYCPNISWWHVTPQYFPGTTTVDYSVTKPTCP